jgi:hypothetical protein
MIMGDLMTTWKCSFTKNIQWIHHFLGGVPTDGGERNCTLKYTNERRGEN